MNGQKEDWRVGRTLSFNFMSLVVCFAPCKERTRDMSLKSLYVHEYIVTSTAVVSRMFVFKSASYIHRTHPRKSGTLGRPWPFILYRHIDLYSVFLQESSGFTSGERLMKWRMRKLGQPTSSITLRGFGNQSNCQPTLEVWGFSGLVVEKKCLSHIHDGTTYFYTDTRHN